MRKLEVVDVSVRDGVAFLVAARCTEQRVELTRVQVVDREQGCAGEQRAGGRDGLAWVIVPSWRKCLGQR